MSRALLVSVAVLLGLGCKGDKGADGTTGADDTGATTGADTATGPTLPPCSDGTWGTVEDPTSAIHVSAALGDDAGDGSSSQPLVTLDAALAAALASSSDKAIAIWPGTYGATLTIGPDPGDGSTFDGISLQGCGQGDVILEAADGTQPVVEVVGSQDIRLSGLTISGGTGSLWVRAGAVVDLVAVIVDGSSDAGIVVYGETTTLTAQDVVVSDPVVGAEAFAYGIAIVDAIADLNDVEISGATSVGILVHGSSAQGIMQAVLIQDTGSDVSGYLGRGIQVQSQAVASISDTVLLFNADAAIFGLQAPGLTIDGVTVDGVDSAGIIDGGSATSGDGVAITTMGADGLSLDPADYPAALTDNVISNWQDTGGRAGIYLEGVSASLAGNSAVDSLGAVSLWTDDQANLSGADVDAGLITTVSALALTRDAAPTTSFSAR